MSVKISISNSIEIESYSIYVTESVKQIELLAKSSHQIHISSKEQANGIKQISDATELVSKGTQNASAISEENASSSEELSAQAQTQNKLATDLNSILKGNENAGSSRPEKVTSSSKVLKFNKAKKEHAAFDAELHKDKKQVAGGDILVGMDQEWERL